MKDLKKWGVWPIIFLYFLFASTFSIGRTGLMHGPSTLFIALRMIISGVLLLSYCKKRKNCSPVIIPQDRWLFFKAAFIGIFLAYVPEFWALQYTKIAKVAFLFALAPFCTFFFEWLKGTTQVTRQKLLGLLIGGIGMGIMMGYNSAEELTHGGWGFLSITEICIMFSVICYSYNWLTVRQLTKERSYSSLSVTGWAMFWGGLMALGTSALVDGWYQGVDPVTNWPIYLQSVALIILAGTSCYLIYTKLLSYYSPTFIAFVGFVEPLFGALYGWIFHGEAVTSIFFVATAIISVGLYIFYKEELAISSA